MELLDNSSESNPVIYGQIWNNDESQYGEFKFYKENGSLVYEFDNGYGSGDQKKGEAVINSDASATVTAKYWWNPSEDGKSGE